MNGLPLVAKSDLDYTSLSFQRLMDLKQAELALACYSQWIAIMAAEKD